MAEAALLQRMSEHFESLIIANRKALALFRSELRQLSSLPPVPTALPTALPSKSAFASGQETKAMSTINERSRAGERGSEPQYSARKVSEDLEVLFEEDPKEQFSSVPRNENFLQKLCSSNRGWTITDTRESLVSFDRAQPNCTDFHHE